MWKRGIVLMVGLVALAVVGAVAVQEPDAQAAAAPKGQVQIDLIVSLPTPDPDDPTALNRNGQLVVSNIGSSGMDGVGVCSPGTSSFQVDSFFDIMYVSNIGSSGQDGVRFQIDSFFDVEYSIARLADPPPGERTIQTEMLSMSLTGNLIDPIDPTGVLDDLRCDVESVDGDIYYGHVTILK
jgi:hypothetical protein